MNMSPLRAIPYAALDKTLKALSPRFHAPAPPPQIPLDFTVL